MIKTNVINGKLPAVVFQVMMTLVDIEVIGTGALEPQKKIIHTTTMILTRKEMMINTKIKSDIRTKSIKRRGVKKERMTLSILHLKIGMRNKALILTAM